MGLIGFNNRSVNIFKNAVSIKKKPKTIEESEITTNIENPSVQEKEKSIVYSLEPEPEIVVDKYRHEDKSKPIDISINGSMNPINETNTGIIYEGFNEYDRYVLGLTENDVKLTFDEWFRKYKHVPDNLSELFQRGDPLPTTLDTFENIIGRKMDKVRNDKKIENDGKEEISLLKNTKLNAEIASNSFDNFLKNGSTTDYIMIAGAIIIVFILIRKS